MWTKESVRKIYSEEIKYKRWNFCVFGDEKDFFLQITFFAKDNFTGKDELQFCRKWKLSPEMSKTELIETAWKAVRLAEEHETREQFLYKGQAIYNPHLSVDSLVELCKQENVIDHK